MWEIENVHKFERLGHSDLVISVCIDPVSMHICVRYEGSMIKQRQERQLQWDRKWLPFKNVIFHVHILGAYAKYEG